ncbi:MAG TPA: 50S ribosomal protein L11 methyltransferase [Kiloniellales bacterium]|nr:50S ribosomal protein L11 methyltransferase [Kiloniellales bacterium]
MIRNLFSWIAWRMAGMMIGLARAMKRVIKSNPTLYGLVYSLRNSQEFSDLFEHEKMLADPVRVDSYAAAIKRAIKPGDRVLDLGTGSGVLSILAARQGAKVYAIDHSDFIHLAAENARQNGVEGISFIHTNSKKFTPPEKLDVLLHEQIGDNLFNENMIENLLELKGRLLKPGGRILPGRFQLFMEPVCLHPEFRVPFMEEIRPHGIDFSYLAEAARSYRAAGYHYRWVERSGVDFFLSKPEPILTVDLNEIDDASAIPQVVEVSRQVIHPGSLDGIQQYFAIIFDEEVSFDTSPFSLRTHWTNRVFRVPQRHCTLGDTISYRIDLGNLPLSHSWKVELLPETGTPRPVPSQATTAFSERF